MKVNRTILVIVLSVLLPTSLIAGVSYTRSGQTDQIVTSTASPLSLDMKTSESFVTTTTTSAPPSTTTTVAPVPRHLARAGTVEPAGRSVARTPTTARTTTVKSTEGSSDWDKLQSCECSPGWHCNTGNGYYGGLQISKYNWDSYIARGRSYAIAGAESYPSLPHLATREQQIAVAIRIRDGVEGTSDPYLSAQGWRAWPRCSRQKGLR